MNAADITRALDARRSGSTWMAKCPSHEDRNASLAIREADGKVLLHCHAGCSQAAVIDALKSRGLWEPTESTDRTIVATYDYTTERGEPLYQIVRYVPKDFRQRYPDGVGGWVWKKHPRQVLYHLPEVLEAAIVFIVEGEKDVETLRSHGFVATTNAGGANAPWLPSYTQALAGREVILIPDRDAPGRRRVLTIARALLRHAAKIVIWEPDDSHAKDITDWFGLGHSEVELIVQVENEEVRQ